MGERLYNDVIFVYLCKAETKKAKKRNYSRCSTNWLFTRATHVDVAREILCMRQSPADTYEYADRWYRRIRFRVFLEMMRLEREGEVENQTRRWCQLHTLLWQL